jgi:hypothetical protein
MFSKPSVQGFPTAADPADCRCRSSFSPLPCQAWNGYGVTSAHRVEVGVGADGPASAPPSGTAAAAPPAGAHATVNSHKSLNILGTIATSHPAHAPACIARGLRPPPQPCSDNRDHQAKRIKEEKTTKAQVARRHATASAPPYVKRRGDRNPKYHEEQHVTTSHDSRCTSPQ